jgi:acetylornithine deacetylase/succinyl-diaminopimelate desuccinylase-like protein
MRLFRLRFASAAPVIVAVLGLSTHRLSAQPAPTAPYQLTVPAPAGVDRQKLGDDAVKQVQSLIRIDTQNPPGNERALATYLDKVFHDAGGFETHVLDVPADPNTPDAPPRANFVARLRAKKPTAKPVLVMGHMDVVGVQREKWNFDPFAAEVHDGYLYGRGSIDDKGMLGTTVTALLEIGKEVANGRELQRDVVFLATAAEEGGADVGIEYMLEHHKDLIGDAEFALNEGGRVRVEGDRIVTVNVQTTEKVAYNVKGVAHGPSGHGSVPLPDNALAALARAVSRIHEWKAAPGLNATTKIYFERLATVEKDPTVKKAMQDLASADAKVREAAMEQLSKNPLHNAVLRTGLSLTILKGGIRSNVIPSDGEATFNVRVMPGESIEAIVKEMNRVGAEPKVEFALDGKVRADPPPSSVDTALYAAVEEDRDRDGARRRRPSLHVDRRDRRSRASCSRDPQPTDC